LILKPPDQWHFQFKSTKRFILEKSKQMICVKGEMAYKTDLGVAKTFEKGEIRKLNETNFSFNGSAAKAIKT
jgi:hypothetical protein